MIKVEKINDANMNFISVNSIDEDVAQFWFSNGNVKYFYFTDEQLALTEDQEYDLSVSGKVKIMDISVPETPVLVREESGVEGSWPYDENMNFIGYGFNI